MFSNLEVLFVDFDGVLTDGFVFTDDNGRESVRCNRLDGLGARLLTKLGVRVYILSSEENSVVKARAQKMNVEFALGVNDKLAYVVNFMQASGIQRQRIGFIGDELNDLQLLKYVDYSFCPSDACQEVKEIVQYKLESAGGEGVLREVMKLKFPSATW